MSLNTTEINHHNYIIVTNRGDPHKMDYRSVGVLEAGREIGMTFLPTVVQGPVKEVTDRVAPSIFEAQQLTASFRNGAYWVIINQEIPINESMAYDYLEVEQHWTVYYGMSLRSFEPNGRDKNAGPYMAQLKIPALWDSQDWLNCVEPYTVIFPNYGYIRYRWPLHGNVIPARTSAYLQFWTPVDENSTTGKSGVVFCHFNFSLIERTGGIYNPKPVTRLERSLAATNFFPSASPSPTLDSFERL